MKFLLLLILFLAHSSSSIAQKEITYSYSAISKTAIDSCATVKYLVTDPTVKKRSGKLIIPITGNLPIKFTDEKEFTKYDYLGNIRKTKFSLVRWSGPNEEKFYMINRLTGLIDTLIAQPVFSNNMTDFACLNNPGTDEKQQIQVCEIKNGLVKTRGFIKDIASVFFIKITCISRNSILTKDSDGKYGKLHFQIDDK